MLSFAGIDLLLDRHELVTDLEDCGLDRARLFPMATPAQSEQRHGPVGAAQPVTPLPRPNYPAPPPLLPNQLYWPSGAARFSQFVALVTRSQLFAILDQFPTVRTDAFRYLLPQQLVIGDGDYDGTIEPNRVNIDGNGRTVLSVGMIPLEAQPVTAIRADAEIEGQKPDDDLWLLPMVDVRYFWQWRKLPHRIPATLLDADARVPETTTTIKETWHGWLRLLRYALDERASVYSAINVDPPVPSPPPAVSMTTHPVFKIQTFGDIDQTSWFYPDRVELDRSQHSAAEILDALAHSCGRRVTRDVTGDIQVLTPTASAQFLQANILDRPVSAGGMRLLPSRDKPAFDQQFTLLTTATDAGFARRTATPEFLDIVFRKLGEFDDAEIPDDVTDSVDRHPDFSEIQMLAGPGTRTMRVDLGSAAPIAVEAAKAVEDDGTEQVAPTLGATNIVPGSVRTIYTPTWVGRQWYAFNDEHETVRVVIDDGACEDDPDPDDEEAVDQWHRDQIDQDDTHDNQEPGLIDDTFYGDRYFRFARAVAINYLNWSQQRFHYAFPGLIDWLPTGYDDHILIDGESGMMAVTSVPPEFGTASYLVQLHRQGTYSPEMLVGMITSQWTLHPKELERITKVYPDVIECELQTEEGVWKELPVRIDCFTEDRFDWTWMWAECFVRPFLPTDPWAPDNSIEYGRTVCWAAAPVVAVSRSRALIDRLRDQLLCDTLPADDAPDDCPSVSAADRDDCWDWDRTDVLGVSNGVVYLRWWGHEWQLIENDCIPGVTVDGQ